MRLLNSWWLHLYFPCNPLWQFPRAAVTNSYRLVGLTQQKVILLQFWRLESKSASQGQNQGISRARVAVEENVFLASSRMAARIPWLMVPPSIQASCVASSL